MSSQSLETRPSRQVRDFWPVSPEPFQIAVAGNLLVDRLYQVGPVLDAPSHVAAKDEVVLDLVYPG